MQTIVKNVQFPHARRWLEGLFGLLITNNRSFCPRVAKTHDFRGLRLRRLACRNVQGAKANDYSRMRLIWPVHGERRSYQSGGLQDAKRIAVAFASVGQDAKRIALAFASARWRLLLQGMLRCCPCISSRLFSICLAAARRRGSPFLMGRCVCLRG